MDKQQWIRHLRIVNAIYYRSDSGLYGYNINNARQSSKGKHTSCFITCGINVFTYHLSDAKKKQSVCGAFLLLSSL